MGASRQFFSLLKVFQVPIKLAINHVQIVAAEILRPEVIFYNTLKPDILAFTIFCPKLACLNRGF